MNRLNVVVDLIELFGFLSNIICSVLTIFKNSLKQNSVIIDRTTGNGAYKKLNCLSINIYQNRLEKMN